MKTLRTYLGLGFIILAIMVLGGEPMENYNIGLHVLCIIVSLALGILVLPSDISNKVKTLFKE